MAAGPKTDSPRPVKVSSNHPFSMTFFVRLMMTYLTRKHATSALDLSRGRSIFCAITGPTNKSSHTSVQSAGRTLVERTCGTDMSEMCIILEGPRSFGQPQMVLHLSRTNLSLRGSRVRSSSSRPRCMSCVLTISSHSLRPRYL